MVRPARHDDDLAIGLQPAAGDESQVMHTSPPLSWQDAAKGGASGPSRRAAPWWRQALTLLRSPVFTAILGALMVLGLLLAFEQVVAQAVTQAEQRRSARDALDAAVWRCKQLRAAGDRGSCLVQVSVVQNLDPPVRQAPAAQLARASLVP